MLNPIQNIIIITIEGDKAAWNKTPIKLATFAKSQQSGPGHEVIYGKETMWKRSSYYRCYFISFKNFSDTGAVFCLYSIKTF